MTSSGKGRLLQTVGSILVPTSRGPSSSMFAGDRCGSAIGATGVVADPSMPGASPTPGRAGTCAEAAFTHSSEANSHGEIALRRSMARTPVFSRDAPVIRGAHSEPGAHTKKYKESRNRCYRTTSVFAVGIPEAAARFALGSYPRYASSGEPACRLMSALSAARASAGARTSIHAISPAISDAIGTPSR